MLNLLLSIFISSAYAMDAVPQGTVTYSEAPAPAAPVITDYSAINASLSDVRGVLSGRTSGIIEQIAERNSAAIEASFASSKAFQAQAEQIEAQAKQLAAATVASPPALTSVDDLTKKVASTRKVIDPSTIADPEESTLPYRFTSPESEFRNELTRLYKDLYKVEPQFGKQKFAKNLGLIVTEEADRAYTLHEEQDAYFYKELGKELLDIVVGLDPVTGFGRSAFELFMGRNLVTGAKLSTTERSFAFLGVATAGSSKFLTQSGRGMWRIYERASHLLQEREAVQAAIREGEILVGHAGRVLDGWKKNHHITAIIPASEGNAKHLARGWAAPYLTDSWIVKFKTFHESKWVRVHMGNNEARAWVMKESAIKGLSPAQIREKFALTEIPTHVSNVIIPSGTSMMRGSVQPHTFGIFPEAGGGAIQYFIDIDHVPSDWFSNIRKLPEVF